jgi:hypothetical protein
VRGGRLAYPEHGLYSWAVGSVGGVLLPLRGALASDRLPSVAGQTWRGPERRGRGPGPGARLNPGTYEPSILIKDTSV